MSGRPAGDAVPSGGISFAVLRIHPAPRYIVVGTVTFTIDIGSLKVLHGIAGIALVPAIVIAFFLAFVFNFTASRRWTFARAASDGHAHQQLVRFFVVAAINLLSTVLIVAGLSVVGVNCLIAKVLATCINASGNYFAARHWIFAAPRSP